MNKILKHLLIWVLILIPYVYLATIWKELPQSVPTHFNAQGTANNFSSKISLLIIPTGLGIFMYILFLIIPIIDPKKKIRQMGKKYDTLSFLLIAIFSLLATYLLFVSKSGNLNDSKILYVIIGSLIAILGNFFQTIRHNYFIGIRTPWTLENENNWKKTHRLAGRIWIVGGLLIILSAFFIKNGHLFTTIFTSLIIIMILIPIIFSFVEFQRSKKIINT